jgi:hypothetical protein
MDLIKIIEKINEVGLSNNDIQDMAMVLKMLYLK